MANEVERGAKGDVSGSRAVGGPDPLLHRPVDLVEELGILGKIVMAWNIVLALAETHHHDIMVFQEVGNHQLQPTRIWCQVRIQSGNVWKFRDDTSLLEAELEVAGYAAMILGLSSCQGHYRGSTLPDELRVNIKNSFCSAPDYVDVQLYGQIVFVSSRHNRVTDYADLLAVDCDANIDVGGSDIVEKVARMTSGLEPKDFSNDLVDAFAEPVEGEYGFRACHDTHANAVR